MLECDRLGQDRDRAGDGPGDHLEHDQRRVGGDRQRRRRACLRARGRARGSPPLRLDQPRSERPQPRGPRWLIASFSASSSSAIVRPSARRRARTPGRSRSRPSRAGPAAMRPSQRPRRRPLDAACRVDVGERADVARARLPAGTSRQQLARFSSSVASLAGEARRAHARAPRRAPRPRSPSRRRSPAAPVAAAAARAFGERVLGERLAVLGRQLDAVGQRLDGDPGGRRAAARTPPACARCGSRASATSTSADARSRGRLRPPRPAPRAAVDAAGRQREQLVEVRARERRALGGRLHLDQPAVAGHHDVRVDLGGRVLAVVEVEQRHAVDDPARDRGDASRSPASGRSSCRRRAAAASPARSATKAPVIDGAARAAVGREHVAVEVDRALAERLEVDDAAQRAADQPLDLDDAPVGAARASTSRGLRWPVDAGSIPYSAVTQPRP